MRAQPAGLNVQEVQCRCDSASASVKNAQDKEGEKEGS